MKRKNVFCLQFIAFLLLLGTNSIFGQTAYTPPALSADALRGIDFSKAKPVDEDYRQTYEKCDDTPVCEEDKNNLNALLKFPDGTVFYESKMSLDLDGSWLSCTDKRGDADQCRTAYMWNDEYPSNEEYRAADDKGVFYKNQAYVDADKIPYMVIPLDRQFRALTGLRVGDLAMVVYRDKSVPVFVADIGPGEKGKIGEGSAALLRAVGVDRCVSRDENNNCTEFRDYSIPRGVMFFVFPHSAIEGLKKENAAETIKAEATKRFEKLKASLTK
jgi:hypothetical protein